MHTRTFAVCTAHALSAVYPGWRAPRGRRGAAVSGTSILVRDDAIPASVVGWEGVDQGRRAVSLRSLNTHLGGLRNSLDRLPTVQPQVECSSNFGSRQAQTLRRLSRLESRVTDGKRQHPLHCPVRGPGELIIVELRYSSPVSRLLVVYLDIFGSVD